jgi:pullulanase-type alpha-1,6-glucosidase
MQKPRLALNLVALLAMLISSSTAVLAAPSASDTPDPETVGLPGTHQDELGCSGDWQPGCEITLLTYDAEDGVWQGTFEIQPGNDDDKNGPRYKAAINGTWDENYGRNASRGGADVPLVVTAATQVKFYYDHETHWVTDNYNTPILVATGDFQQQLGCAANDDAGCLRSWLQDPDGDGGFALVTKALKAGDYTVTLTQNEDPAQVLSAPQSFSVGADGDEIYFGYDNVKKQLVISTTGAPKGSLAKQRAHWVSRDTILWNVVGSPKYSYSFFYSPDATLEQTAEGLTGGTEVPLTYVKEGAGSDITRQFPHLGAYTAFKLDPSALEQVPEIVKGQLAVLARDDTGKVVDVTALQIPGVLDDIYNYDGPLGPAFEGDVPVLRVWAPTARRVTLHLFDDPLTSFDEAVPMRLDSVTGVWSAEGLPDWTGKYYLYEVEVYVPATGKFETNLVTDPYSLSLSMNSARSQIVDLSDPATKPQGWDETGKPALAAPEDIVVYELHIRDFSIHDETVPEELRGTYLAFTQPDSNGMKHLKALAQAGLTHLHLLPAFDIASVNEDKSTWRTVNETALSALPPDSDGQSAAVSLISGTDGFNWGYDPLHYTAPEGSYATNPQGVPRIVEFRQMVQAINGSGLRVVMDVVYNHTNASGQDPNSVLDKVVPGYYHRLNADGNVETSTCCQNTATEHEMMRKLMVDSAVTWAREYKVDGFRFDLMGHHMLADMQAVRAALDALTLSKDGVDGKSIYIYGEGWDFGEVAHNARGKNASQLNIGGSGIGVFNDRLRDGARGGSPFTDPRVQGFATGLFLQPNAAETLNPEQQKSDLLEATDWIRVGLAGNLRDYQIVRGNGDTVPANLVLYNGAPAGYTLDPQENIIYVSAHDNETLFDAVQAKAASEATLADRIRMNNLALSLAMFSQGVPFFHAGDDILRSKSLDRNSYDSGDWFNKLDWTYETNNWGVGLPPQGTDHWDIFRPLLANRALAPTKADILNASAHFLELLQIRQNSNLFRLQTADQVEGVVSFYNTGPEQIPGLIVMRLRDTGNYDPNVNDMVVLFNASPEPVTFSNKEFIGLDFALNSVQQVSNDALVRDSQFDPGTGSFSVAGRTTAVFTILGEPETFPTPTATTLPAPTTEPSPTPTPTPTAGSSPTGVVALAVALIAALGAGIAWLVRRGRKE